MAGLAGYVERMKEGQEAIFYIAGEDAAKITQSPHLEGFKKLILNKKFLLLFVRTLEGQQGKFSLQDK